MLLRWEINYSYSMVRRCNNVRDRPQPGITICISRGDTKSCDCEPTSPGLHTLIGVPQSTVLFRIGWKCSPDRMDCTHSMNSSISPSKTTVYPLEQCLYAMYLKVLKLYKACLFLQCTITAGKLKKFRTGLSPFSFFFLRHIMQKHFTRLHCFYYNVYFYNNTFAAIINTWNWTK